MAVFNFYFASCVLLLALSLRTSTGSPVRAEKCGESSLLFKKLLLNITQLLNSDVLCYGIPSNNTVAVRNETETVLSCAPDLTQTDCLRNIMKDLAHYAAAIQSYINSPLRRRGEEGALLSPTLGIIQSLRKNCSPMPDGKNDSSEENSAAQMWGNNTYNNRQEMCKMMRGFYIRTITINRAVSYITSGDDRK